MWFHGTQVVGPCFSVYETPLKSPLSKGGRQLIAGRKQHIFVLGGAAPAAWEPRPKIPSRGGVARSDSGREAPGRVRSSRVDGSLGVPVQLLTFLKSKRLLGRWRPQVHQTSLSRDH